MADNYLEKRQQELADRRPKVVRPHPSLESLLKRNRSYRGYDASRVVTEADLLKLLTFFPVEKVHVLEYWLDVSYFSNWRRPLRKIACSAEVMRRDLEFYCSLGIRNFASFAVMMDSTYFAQFGDEELYAYGRALNELF